MATRLSYALGHLLPAVRIDPQAEFRWIEVFHIWGWLAIYLFFFLVHNYLIAPQLLRKQRKLYVAFVALMVLTFTLFNGWFGPKMHDMRPPRPQDEVAKMEKPKHHKRYYHGFMLGPDVPINIMVLLGIIGINLGVKLYFKSEADRANLQQLEKERIFLQLQYLRFQINPHFFMNTLNNIQVLIDMDAEKAKASLRDLSVMMRFVLYDGGRDWVLLQREAAFLRKYILLMRLRYTDRLVVTVDIPDNLPDGKVPPLIFGTFVENAFKHGVSLPPGQLHHGDHGCRGRQAHLWMRQQQERRSTRDQCTAGERDGIEQRQAASRPHLWQ